ncbi:hypothetical protein BD779DRAFT_1791792 [Infundibulicybe gibba]|nr:hypothetical protein BD779DRAFT_1791792 [Infundibulicybe gibba]
MVLPEGSSGIAGTAAGTLITVLRYAHLQLPGSQLRKADSYMGKTQDILFDTGEVMPHEIEFLYQQMYERYDGLGTGRIFLRAAAAPNPTDTVANEVAENTQDVEIVANNMDAMSTDTVSIKIVEMKTRKERYWVLRQENAMRRSQLDTTERDNMGSRRELRELNSKGLCPRLFVLTPTSYPPYNLLPPTYAIHEDGSGSWSPAAPIPWPSIGIPKELQGIGCSMGGIQGGFHEMGQEDRW